MKVSIADAQLTSRHKNLVNEVLDSNRLTYGPKTIEFEKRFAKRVGNKHAIFVNSGTSALHVAISAMKMIYGWQDGDEIIVPAITFPATINTVLHNNLVPVFVDVDTSFGMSVDSIEKYITPRTRAIIPVHMFGQMCDVDEIQTISKKHNLKIIIDACESSFAKLFDKPVGHYGDIFCHSTYLAHLISTGVGGFVTVDDNELMLLVRSLVWHGRDGLYLNKDDNSLEVVERRFRFDYVGYNFRATEMEAALGLAEMELLDGYLEKRQKNAAFLTKLLGDLSPEYLSLPSQGAGKTHNWMFYPIMLLDRKADKLILFLEENGIETRHLMPITNQPVYKDFNFEHCQMANFINTHGFLVGCHQYLTEDHLTYISEKIHEFLA